MAEELIEQIRQEVSAVLSDLAPRRGEPLLYIYELVGEPTYEFDDSGIPVSDYVVMLRDVNGPFDRFVMSSGWPADRRIFWFADDCQDRLVERTGESLPMCPLHDHPMWMRDPAAPHWACDLHRDMSCSVGDYWRWRDELRAV